MTWLVFLFFFLTAIIILLRFNGSKDVDESQDILSTDPSYLKKEVIDEYNAIVKTNGTKTPQQYEHDFQQQILSSMGPVSSTMNTKAGLNKDMKNTLLSATGNEVSSSPMATPTTTKVKESYTTEGAGKAQVNESNE